MPHFERHIFVCVNRRDPDNQKGCCASKGAEQVRAAFKREVAVRGCKGLVRANSSGCLDQCQHGVSVVIYPEQVWYGGVTEADVPEIVEKHVLGGHVVERLLMPEQPEARGLVALTPRIKDRSK